MNIIGLGKAGCKIAELFKQYSQYTVFKMDTDEKLKRKKNCFYIPRQGSAELYDANPIDLKRLKSNMDEDDVYFITCGSGKVSACSLWILREVSSQKKVNIVYINYISTNLKFYFFKKGITKMINSIRAISFTCSFNINFKIKPT